MSHENSPLDDVDKTFKLLRQSGAVAVRPLEGALAFILLDGDGGIDASLLKKMFGVNRVFLQDSRTGVFALPRRAVAGRTYIVHTSRLTELSTSQLKSLQSDRLRAATALPADMARCLRSRLEDKGSSATQEGNNMGSCCGKATLKVARPAWQKQLQTFLKTSYPKWGADADMRGRVLAACALLDSLHLHTFHDLAMLGLDGIHALSLPTGLRNTLLEGLYVFLCTGAASPFPHLLAKEMESAHDKYHEFKRMVDHTGSHFNPWLRSDIDAAAELQANFRVVVEQSNSLVPVFEAAMRLLQAGQDSRMVDWAMDRFISTEKRAKALRLMVSTPEFFVEDPSMSTRYMQAMEGTRDMGDSLDQFKVSPFTFDLLLAYHHIIWHGKYSSNMNTLREGEYFLHMHYQMLTLYRFWLMTHSLPDIKSTRDNDFEVPEFRASDQFHKHGAYGGEMIPYRVKGCPRLDHAIVFYANHAHLKEVCIQDKNGLYRWPTEKEIASDEYDKKVGSFTKREWLSASMMVKDRWKVDGTLQDYRNEIDAAIKSGWEFPFGSVKNPKGVIKVMDKNNPLWMCLTMFGSMISEVYKRGKTEVLPSKDKKISLQRYHAYYHTFGGSTMLPEYLNVKDPLFYAWHRELDDYRLQCMLAYPTKEDLKKPTISLGKVASSKVKIFDVIIKEHVDGKTDASKITSLATLQNFAKDAKATDKLQLGVPPEVPDIDKFSGKKFTKTPSDLGDASELNHVVLTGTAFQTGFEPSKSGFIPFCYFIRVGTEDGKALKENVLLSVRIFICPADKIDADNHRWWFEMDKFSANFDKGKSSTVITRSVLESAVIMRKSVQLVDSGSAYGTNGEKCDCGLPWNLLLPPGTKNGQDYKMFFMLTDSEQDLISGLKMSASNFSLTMCWGKGKGTPDQQTMGYPFEANPKQKASQMVACGRHIYMRSIKVKRHDIIAKGIDMKTIESDFVGKTQTVSKDAILKFRHNEIPYFDYVVFDKDQANKDDKSAFDQKMGKLLFDYAKQSNITLSEKVQQTAIDKRDHGPIDLLKVKDQKGRKNCAIM